MSTIRPLKPEDAEAVYALRLRGLKEHPEAFGSSYEDELAQGIERWRSSLEPSENRILFGAFLEDVLVGMVLIYRNRNKYIVWESAQCMLPKKRKVKG